MNSIHLKGILRLITTSNANSTCEKDVICSFFFLSMMREVTIRKRKYVLEHFAANEAHKQPCSLP